MAEENKPVEVPKEEPVGKLLTYPPAAGIRANKEASRRVASRDIKLTSSSQSTLLLLPLPHPLRRPRRSLLLLPPPVCDLLQIRPAVGIASCANTINRGRCHHL